MFNREEIIEILSSDENDAQVFETADKIRQEHVGNEVHLRGLIEFSNICKCQCKYCGLQCTNRDIERYRLSAEEILSSVETAVELGYKTIVLQSGEDSFYTREVLCELISKIKEFDVALTLSIGERSRDDYKAFKEAGADRYLIRIETTDKNLYKTMHPNMEFSNRVRCLEDLKTLGYEVGTGCLVGIPGQTIESLADDILFFKEINADMVGIGPFISHPQTPLKNYPNGSFNLALKVMALTRILLKNINIPATTAMETLNPNGRMLALKSGANVVMPNVTTTEYRKKYEIYPNKSCINEDAIHCRKCIEKKILSIGRTISTTKGFRDKK